ncbi:hypothetical protein [Thermus thalpophilus]|uniref:hypothetical protein n=1 Tax=Thermus thalpophilus TaxID=2908147 RepID=UPI001FAABB61|nr:hypothetical protein [Thermus thalpophilus]
MNRHWNFFLSLPETPRAGLKLHAVKDVQLLEPLFEFPGACAGCGETPYLRLLSQLFGDRLIVANATGCSSIYGGNLPTTPWSKNKEGRGPAWANSLFEDNAEFGLGMRLALDKKAEHAKKLLPEFREVLGEDLLARLLAEVGLEGVTERRRDVALLRERLSGLDDPKARDLLAVADALIPHSVWIVGGDGWAYDIGYGGLDHVLASGANVKVLVLDTEVYSNTGGQASKATGLGAVAKALVLFNRFYQPDFDLETLSVVPTLSLSRPYEALLRIHWIALLYGRVGLELALTGGVHTGKEAVKGLLAGAQVVMMTSAILERGPGHFRTVLAELKAFMEEKEYASVAEMRGVMSYQKVAEPAALERANYLKVLGSYRLLP